MIPFTYKTAFLFSIFLCIISTCSALKSCGAYTSKTFFLCEGQTIASNGEIRFELGFFTPKGNSNKSKYVGIWYLEDPETVVWVANRDRPLPENSTGSFAVLNNGDGNLHLLDEQGNSFYSTGLDPPQRFNSRTVRLQDNGNLVLSDEGSEMILWQSFDHPTDTFLPGMKMSENLKLISWRSPDDPSSGNFRFEQEEEETVNSGYVIMNRTIKYWKSGGGSRNFTITNKMNDLAANLLINYNPPNREVLTKPPYRELNVSTNLNFNKTRLLMSSLGKIEYFTWNIGKKNWLKIWSVPQTRCSVYNACGNFGYCKEGGSHASVCQDLSLQCRKVGTPAIIIEIL